MRFIKYRLILFIWATSTFLAILTNPINTFSQIGRVSVTGGSIQLIVSSLSQYNDGITLNNWTRVKITYTDNSGALDWQLRVQALTSGIMSDGSDPSLSLSYLKIIPISIVANGTSYFVPSDFLLKEQPNGDILIDGTGTDNTFDISFGLTYQFGTAPTPSLINAPWGFYYTTLHFSLEDF